MRYHICAGNSIEEVMKSVNKKLSEGWEPYSDLIISTMLNSKRARDEGVIIGPLHDFIETSVMYSQTLIKNKYGKDNSALCEVYQDVNVGPECNIILLSHNLKLITPETKLIPCRDCGETPIIATWLSHEIRSCRKEREQFYRIICPGCCNMTSHLHTYQKLAEEEWIQRQLGEYLPDRFDYSSNGRIIWDPSEENNYLV